jgi:hypothetical protein
MLIYVLVGVAVLIATLIGFIASRPERFVVSRSEVIAAPAEVIFGQVNDLHKWEPWSPWEKLDPHCKRTFEGAPAGVGAVYGWLGDPKTVGSGRMTILESVPAEKIVIKLEFFTPFKGLAVCDFVFTPQGEKTKVTWSMRGTCNFMAKAMHLVMNMDKMIGTQYAKGLADLKVVVEGEKSGAGK